MEEALACNLYVDASVGLGDLEALARGRREAERVDETRLMLGALELEPFENPSWGRRPGAGGYLRFQSVVSITPRPGVSREAFVRDLGWLLGRLRDPIERRAVASCSFANELPQRRLALALDASVPETLVFTYRGFDDLNPFRAWAEIREAILVFAFSDRPGAVIAPRVDTRGLATTLGVLADVPGALVEPLRIEASRYHLFGWRKQRVLVDDVVGFLPRCPDDLLASAAADDAFCSRGTLVFASLLPDDMEAARDVVQVTSSGWERGRPLPALHEALFCRVGGHSLVWHRPHHVLPEIARFAESLAAAKGWSFELDLG